MKIRIVLAASLLSLTLANTEANTRWQQLHTETPASQNSASTRQDNHTTPPTTYTPPHSAWLNAQRQRAITRLSDKTYDLLVVPIQTSGNSLDATSRSLMTLSIAQRIANGTRLTVADPLLVSEALGSNRRVFSKEAVTALADKLKVKQVIVGFVHTNATHTTTAGGTFTLSSHMLQRDASGALNGKLLNQYTETDIPFSYTEPPYHAFLDKRDNLINTVLSPARPLPDQPKYLSDRTALDLSGPIKQSLTNHSKNTLQSIHTLQLLGSLHAPGSSSRERSLLFERSLVLLEEFNPESSDYLLLRARAMAQLNRRPAAVKLLQAATDSQNTKELEWLGEYLDGNLLDSNYIDAIDTANSLNTISILENTRLTFEYHREPDWNKLSTALNTLHEEWRFLVSEAALDQYIWQDHTNGSLKLLLDISVHEPEFSMNAIEMRLSINSNLDIESEFTRATLKHADSLELQSKEDAGLYPQIPDLAGFVRNAAAENTIQRINRFQTTLGKPDLAIEVAENQLNYFKDHPDLAVTIGMLRYKHGDRNQLADHGKMIVDGILWANTRTELIIDGINRVATLGQSFHNRTGNAFRQLPFVKDWPAPANTGPDCLKTSISGQNCLVYSMNLALAKQNMELATRLLKENSHRFSGHPDQLDFKYQAYKATGDRKGILELQHLVMNNGTAEWALYDRVASSLMLDSNYTEALQVIKKYPGFHEQGHANAVTLANRAYEFGSKFWWSGAHEQARELYKLASQFSTASEGEMAANVRLALLAGDYNTAIDATMHRVRRYRSKYALRDLTGLLIHTGQLDQAANVLDSVKDRLDEPEIWTSIVLYQRAKEYTPTQITDWLNDNNFNSLGAMYFLPTRHVFQSHVVDREVSSQLGKWIQDRHEQEHLIVLKSIYPNATPESHAQEWKTIQNRPVSSLPIHGANGISALQRSDYKAAYAHLDLATEQYGLHEFMAYYALASIKTGNTVRVEKYLAQHSAMRDAGPKLMNQPTVDDQGFDANLANAVLLAGKGKHKQALTALERLNNDVLHTRSRYLYTRYQIMDISRLLFLHTGQQIYRDFTLNMAQRNDIIEPIQSYSASFIAMLSDEPSERISALAKVLRLDAGSRSIKYANATELEKARKLVRIPESRNPNSAHLGI